MRTLAITRMRHIKGSGGSNGLKTSIAYIMNPAKTEDGILVGEIVNVSADESVVTDGVVDIKKLKPISFDPFGNAYFGVGEKVGNAFRDGAALK